MRSNPPRQGSKFILQIPLTLANRARLVVKAAGQSLPSRSNGVNEAVGVDEESHTLQIVRKPLWAQDFGTKSFRLRAGGYLGLPAAELTTTKLVVILGLRGKNSASWVDDVVGIQEIVVQPLGRLFLRAQGLLRHTILATARSF